MSATGFSRDEMWATIKQWTRHSQSSVGRDLHEMAVWYEGRKKIGIMPPDSTELSTPPARVQQERAEVNAAQQHAAGLPSAAEVAAVAESRSGSIVHETA
ncbi:MAG: hypothetical protein LDL30_05660 [Desulfovibrio sp.]|nr:hypothetical protein [Desulfovibrio sp.]